MARWAALWAVNPRTGALPMGRARKHREGQYAPLPYALLKSDAWRSLSGAAVRVFLELHTRYNGSNNGNVRLSFAEAGRALGIGKATVQRAYDELIDKGLLRLESEGNWYHRKAHEWRLTTKPVQKIKGQEPASNEWRNYRLPKTERGSGMDQNAG
ncbi:helix-turn-helix domain-containing protein [Palleronia sp. LCG004]|uniref:helix-turn-helix domain-containing protein n=1 Tax=Palleronia sp. LCG004 TaxID=3079304 RepID=UPI002943E360|nr:helix-turn-helix domain-containing protein [Palleronia sp. LCG004]WOI55589.1 helix-turn-helix domain-containing protein [Palleronia sp. LCG004]